MIKAKYVIEYTDLEEDIQDDIQEYAINVGYSEGETIPIEQLLESLQISDFTKDYLNSICQNESYDPSMVSIDFSW